MRHNFALNKDEAFKVQKIEHISLKSFHNETGKDYLDKDLWLQFIHPYLRSLCTCKWDQMRSVSITEFHKVRPLFYCRLKATEKKKKKNQTLPACHLSSWKLKSQFFLSIFFYKYNNKNKILIFDTPSYRLDPL